MHQVWHDNKSRRQNIGLENRSTFESRRNTNIRLSAGSGWTIPACDIPDIFAGAPCGKVNTSTALKST